jgi:vancomycin permeability regulator SanA
MLRDRLDFAYKLYEQGSVRKILVSGDHGETNYDEVNAMRAYLVEKGAAIEDVFMDHAGFDTYDTMYRARDIFEVQSAIVCTQKYHLYRACYIARRLGIDVAGVPSDVYVSRKLPYFRLREWAARIKAFAEVEILHTLPIMGDAIPITGDGRITEDGKT